MKSVWILIFSILFLTGCSNNKEHSEEQLKIEKEKIKSQIGSFLSAYENKNMDKIISMLSNSSSFFYMGSDLNEIGRSKADYQNQMDMDWRLFDSIKFGKIKNSSVIISPDDKLASALIESTIEAMISGNSSSFTVRMSYTLVNENGVWKIVQNLVSVPSVGQSSVELVQKKESAKNSK